MQDMIEELKLRLQKLKGKTDSEENLKVHITMWLLEKLGYDRDDMDFEHSLCRKDKVRYALKLVNLDGFEKRMPDSLSGGQQQRVAIARAIVTRPKLLLADEPTGSLDSHRSVEIMELLQQLNEEEKITVALVTHEPDMAEYAKRKVHFRDGRLASDSAEEFT